MKKLSDIGQEIASYRLSLGLKQREVAKLSGIPQESLSRFERGHVAEFGSRKLLAVLDALGLEIAFNPVRSKSGSVIVDENIKKMTDGMKEKCVSLGKANKKNGY